MKEININVCNQCNGAGYLVMNDKSIKHCVTCEGMGKVEIYLPKEGSKNYTVKPNYN